MMNEYEILDDDSEFYRHLGIDDAQIWIKGLVASNNVPEIMTVEDTLKAADYYFDKYYEMNSAGKPKDENYENYRNLYKQSFSRKALLYIKDIRKKKADADSQMRALKSEYALEGGVEASKWFAAIYDASFAPSINEKDAERVASITYKYLHDTEEDKELRTSFIGSFIRVAKILFSSLKKNDIQTQDQIT